MTWLTISVLRKRSIWPQLSDDLNCERIIIHENKQFVVYEEDKSYGSGSIYNRGKVFPFGKSRWFHRAVTDREALEAAIAYAKDGDAASGPYRVMANEITEIQDLVDGL